MPGPGPAGGVMTLRRLDEGRAQGRSLPRMLWKWGAGLPADMLGGVRRGRSESVAQWVPADMLGGVHRGRSESVAQGCRPTCLVASAVDALKVWRSGCRPTCLAAFAADALKVWRRVANQAAWCICRGALKSVAWPCPLAPP
eukprot:359540-Chlamydomonas_euryale.AAC.11